MRVAVDATPLIGAGTGVATFVDGALRALAERGDVELVGYGQTLRGRGDLAEELPSGVTGSTRPMPAGLLLGLWSRLDWPKAETWTGRVDVVHGMNFVVPPTRDAAMVVTVHDLTAVRWPEMCAPTSRRYPRLIQRAVKRGAFVHTPSEAMAQEVVDLLGVDRSRVRAVHHGLPAMPDGDPQKGRELAGVDRYVVAVGTVEPRKGLPDLVAAFDRLARSHPDLSLVVAGPDGWGTDEFNAAIGSSSVADRVIRIGWLGDQERADLVAGADALAYPSLYEGFGFPPLEAMALGTPVVTTTAGALPEVVGDAARLVPPGDVYALAAAIDEVISDDAVAARLVEHGRRRVGVFTWDKCAAGLVELYRRALDSR